jgi:predicted phage terminase large subunit-like protein
MTVRGVNDEEVNLSEVIQLAAVDNDFYGKFFFPKTIRQSSPGFHQEMDDALDGPDRYVAMMLFRGAAKTTKLRIYLSKRVGFAISRTIVIVGKSQGHAIRTVEWMKRQVEYNKKWATAFNLRKGSKWSNEEIEIYHGTDEVPIRLIALGITGSTRGINFDDFRPDLIIVDDPSDEENTATQEQRDKTDDFINGSLRNSLAPTSEAPMAKMVFLQTLLHEDDSISRCEKDPAWTFIRQSIFTESGESVWPERWSTEELLKEKESFTLRGRLHLWMREMECKILSETMAVFRANALRYYDLTPEEGLVYYLSIDPVPPPSEREIAKGLKGKDYEVIAVGCSYRRKVFLLEYHMNRGHNPDWTIAKFFEVLDKYPIRKALVETVNYQATLKWLLEQAMRGRNRWVQVSATPTKGSKQYRITDAIGATVAEGNLFVRASQSDFIQQYMAYPKVDHDDVIDAVSMICAEVIRTRGHVLEGEYEDISDNGEALALQDFRHCP